MPNFLVRKLENFIRLSGDDKRVLHEVATERVQNLAPREDLISEGDKPEHANVVLSGWAWRYKGLEDGRRQVIGLFLPGDTCDDHAFLLREMDHSVGAVTPLSCAQIPREAFERVAREQPRLMLAFHFESLVNIAIQREWTFNIGTRSALERLSHLFCEIYARLNAVGLAPGMSCEVPLTQTDLGQMLGLSSVHINRMLQELRGSRLISLQRGILTIHDMAALQNLAFFNPAYLHLGHEGRAFDAEEAKTTA